MTARTLALVGLCLGIAIVGSTSALAAEDVTIDESSLPIAADDQQVIRGETTISPGEELTVRLRSSSAENPFLRQYVSRVRQNGTFVAVFDMSQVPANTSYSLVVHYDGTTLLERDETVVGCDGDCSETVPPTPTPTPTPEQTPWDGTGVDVRPHTTVEQGATAEIPVSMDGAETVTIAIGDSDVNYRINATITDGNGDGEARMLFDTSNAGTDGATLAVADDGDELTVIRPETELPSTIDPAEYPIRQYDGSEPTGEPVALGRLSVTDDGTEDTDYNVSDAPEFGFEQSIYRTRQGERARLTISLAAAESATVSIGGPEPGYEINATVRDGNGDDRVTLLFDTQAAGHSGQTLTTENTADTVEVEPGSEVALDTRLDADDYPLSLTRGSEMTGDIEDIGTLVVQTGDGATRTATKTAALPDNGTATQRPDSDLNAGAGALAVGAVFAVAGAIILLRSTIE